jgi:hypothetical protein
VPSPPAGEGIAVEEIATMVHAPSLPLAGPIGDRCTLTEPTGEPLAAGTLHARYDQSGWDWLVVRFDRPGRMIERCLPGSLRQVLPRRRRPACLVRA